MHMGYLWWIRARWYRSRQVVLRKVQIFKLVKLMKVYWNWTIKMVFGQINCEDMLQIEKPPWKHA